MPADSRPTARLEPGLPAWITPELIAETIRVWQPYYAAPLSAVDAVEILVNTAILLDSIGDRTGGSDDCGGSQ
ncbi:MAG: hypothetical protein KDA32_06900 [Phycisphaerales bacterium]|nr:hypothetical protein [Phycisphaerales bacterium]